MLHGAVTIYHGKEYGCKASWFPQSGDPEKGFGSPLLSGAAPHMRHALAKPSLITYHHPPPALTLFHQNKPPSSLPFVKTSSPALGTQCPALVLQPPLPDWKPLQGRHGWKKGLCFQEGACTGRSLAHRGRESPHSCQLQTVQLNCQLRLLWG